ncbi:PDE9A [Symbiodinium sp. CCMP2592]|nr:PDE9A [Symbiodinium sp. CCMP2592]
MGLDRPKQDSGTTKRSRARLSTAPLGDEPKVGMCNWCHHLRFALQGSDFYNSSFAWRVRQLMQSRCVSTIMMLALAVALVLPDLSKLMDVSQNVWPDTVMTMSMVMFTCELLALSLTDANYLFSFFQCMDMVGTASMVFDISFLMGVDVAEPTLPDQDTAQSRVMLLRASRAARVGARAGRLTRILRLCRCLIDLDDEDSSGKRRKIEQLEPKDEAQHPKRNIAKVISVRLGNLLATRVACLTIFLAMVMPLFDVMAFPQKDLSLDAWVGQVSYTNEHEEAATVSELRKMAKFFAHHSYGPFAACKGHLVHDKFVCSEWYQDWDQVNSAPVRNASAWMVRTPTFQVIFDMSRPVKVKAAVALLSMLFTVCIMLCFSIALSSVVTDLAVTPLERMLGTVREIAATVFRFSSIVIGQQEEEESQSETTDIDNAGEMILLEKVVEKLSAIAAVHASIEHVLDTEDMDEENIGILSMLHGDHTSRSSFRSHPLDKERSQSRILRITPDLSLEANGVDEETFNSLRFNVFDLTPLQLNKMTFHVMLSHASSAAIFNGAHGEEALLQTFVSAVHKGYPDNPFHNFCHAVDVQTTIVKMMKLTEADDFLSHLEQCSLLVAGLGHDIGHPGFNNGFLSEVGHELAMKYNDRSPLENMHCAVLYQLLAKPETELFGSLSDDDYKEVRRICVETILHTDMACHQNMVKDLNLLYQIHAEALRQSASPQPGRVTSRPSIARPSRRRRSVLEGATDPSQIFSAPEHKMLVMESLLHAADVSNPAREWNVTQAWADKCLEEFFAQGDQERSRGIPVQFLNDRQKLNRPHSQIGFIEFMISPLFAAQIWLWPNLFEYGSCLSLNIGMWQELWEEETDPSEDELEKAYPVKLILPLCRFWNCCVSVCFYGGR